MGRNSSGEGSAAIGSNGRKAAPGVAVGALASLLALLALLLVPATVAALPDGRQYELVSPADKHGASVAPLGEGFQGPLGGITAASPSGNALTYVTDSPIESHPEGNRALEGNQTLATRSEAPPAWNSRDIVTPHLHGEGLSPGEPQEYRIFSPDLSAAAVTPIGLITNPNMEPPLVTGKESEERGIYRRLNANCEGGKGGCFEAVVNTENDTTHKPYGGKLEYEGASPDVAHVVFGAPEPLTTPASEEEPAGLYESFPEKPAAEQLQLISLLPGNAKPATEPKLGGITAEAETGRPARNAVSSDGSRVFWNGTQVVTKGETERTFRYIFMRDTQTGVTVRIDAPVEGVKEPFTEAFEANRHSKYEAASADGSRIFFTSNVSLTPESKVKPKEAGPVNLYVCEIPTTTPVTETTTCKLHDLTAGFKGGIGDVVGMVSSVSEDGRTVYFVADGAPEGGKKGNCPTPLSQGGPTPSQRCNLYVAKAVEEEVEKEGKKEKVAKWEAPKLIAEISGEDNPDFGGITGTELGLLTARTSPSGRWFAFMSELPLTGYDNRDLNPLAKEARDEEVFLYDSSSGKIICPSCNPNPAQRPRGVYDDAILPTGPGEPPGLVVDPFAHEWPNRWLAGSIPAWTSIEPHTAPYQSRYLLDNGRLYFTSSDALVPHEVELRSETLQVPIAVKEGEEQKFEAVPTEVGVENVYQYEPEGGVSLISSGTSKNESGFLDASESGNDVFFTTAAQLVPSDFDTTYDAYDARVCTTECVKPPPPSPPPCASESSCRSGTGSPPPIYGNAPSSTFNGPGNIPKVEVLGSTTSKPKPLTNKQKLAKALSSCRKKYKHSRHKRQSCERKARRAYGAATKKGKKK